MEIVIIDPCQYANDEDKRCYQMEQGRIPCLQRTPKPGVILTLDGNAAFMVYFFASWDDVISGGHCQLFLVRDAMWKAAAGMKREESPFTA